MVLFNWCRSFGDKIYKKLNFLVKYDFLLKKKIICLSLFLGFLNLFLYDLKVCYLFLKFEINICVDLLVEIV